MRTETKAVIMELAKEALAEHKITYTQFLHIMQDTERAERRAERQADEHDVDEE